MKIALVLSMVVSIMAHSTMVCLDVDKANAANPNPILRCNFHSRKFDAYNHFHDGTGGDESFAWVASDGQPSWSGEYSGNTRNGCFLKGQGDSTPGQNGCVDWTANYNCAGCKYAQLRQGDSFTPMHYARGHGTPDATSMVSLYLSRIIEGTPEYSDPNIDKTTSICTYPFRSTCESTGNQATTPCYPTTPCTIPADVAPGNYTLVWRWLWKFTSPNDRSDYCSAADLKILASGATPTPTPTVAPPAPTPSTPADGQTDVKVFVTVTLKKAPSIVSTQDFATEVTGVLALPKSAVDEVSIDLDQSTDTTTFVRFVLTNAVKSDGTRVEPVAAAYKLRDMVNNKDPSLKSTFYLSDMQIHDVTEGQTASGDVPSNTTLIIIVCVAGGVVLIAVIVVTILVITRRRKGGQFF